MAREVVKKIGNREYRYRVEGVRDAESGRTRTRWTYLGRANAAGAAAEPMPQRAAARERLIAALERLLERADADDLPSAGDISREAGLAHGTFYRYFTNKEAAFDELLTRLRSLLSEARPSIDDPPESVLEAKAQVRAWIETSYEEALVRPGLLRAAWRRFTSDPALRALRMERRVEGMEILTAYFADLDVRGLARIPAPRALAEAVTLLVEAPFRAVKDHMELDARALQGVIDLVERGIFGSNGNS